MGEQSEDLTCKPNRDFAKVSNINVWLNGVKHTQSVWMWWKIKPCNFNGYLQKKLYFRGASLPSMYVSSKFQVIRREWWIHFMIKEITDMNYSCCKHFCGYKFQLDCLHYSQNYAQVNSCPHHWYKGQGHQQPQGTSSGILII